MMLTIFFVKNNFISSFYRCLIIRNSTKLVAVSNTTR
jgi:hypothetical protein